MPPGCRLGFYREGGKTGIQVLGIQSSYEWTKFALESQVSCYAWGGEFC